MVVDAWWRAAVDAACDRTREAPHRGRDEVELLLDGWYRLLGLQPPHRVIWVEDPSEVRPIVAAISAGARARGGDGLHVVDASLAISHAGDGVPALVVDEIIDAVVGEASSTAEPSFRDVFGRVVTELHRDLVDAVGPDVLDAIAQRAFQRAGSMRADRVLLLGDLLGWYRPGEDAAWLRPIPVRWFSPEMIDALAESGVAGMAAWRGWAKLVRSVLSVWAFRGIAVLCPPPIGYAVDPQGRPHSEDGPALRWESSWEVFAWHGTVVPRSLIEQPWPARSILHTRNAEVRRCAIERLGWDRFVADLDLVQVGDAVPDPGNPGHTLALFEVPRGILDQRPSRVLLCTNATVERDGTRRQYGLEVPPLISDPISAAAWTFGIDPYDYLTLTTAT